ncbi:carboxypeptidase Y precursor [Rhizoctonia solani AG-1 IB]|uniref:carboxypeptidase C n=1 Tax=Thanatephorus cucumeris (strain AG1-IB / isolate 7/3/14) TaxID=1108050 RepID=A0A0B7FWE6_THACB|nr:carboxypeptidase Y precursor [Rhizoctonia solani AG-1 IB]
MRYRTAQMIYLDQPAGTGYSYSTSPHIIDNSQEAAKDFYAFVQLFLKRFPQYMDRPFHVLSESHGGQYATNFANYINRRNKAQARNHQYVHLESILIINGLVNAAIQDETPPEYACSGPYAFWENHSDHCEILRSRIPRFQKLFQQCREFKTPLTCVPAMIYGHSGLQEGFEKTGLNRFDVRRSCTGLTNCYHELGWAQNYFNHPEMKAVLGVPDSVDYKWISANINWAFTRAGDDSHDAMPAVQELLEGGVRVLNIAGDTDFACNFIGAFEWMYQLDTAYTKAFRALKNTIWILNERPVTSLGYASTKLDIGFLTTNVKLPLSFLTDGFTINP